MGARAARTPVRMPRLCPAFAGHVSVSATDWANPSCRADNALARTVVGAVVDEDDFAFGFALDRCRDLAGERRDVLHFVLHWHDNRKRERHADIPFDPVCWCWLAAPVWPAGASAPATRAALIAGPRPR